MFLELEKNKEGFTLVESLIYVAIIGIAVSSFISFGVSISGSRNKTYVVEETQANARVALDMISRYIRSASGVNASSSVFDLDPGVLSLAMDNASKNPTIIRLNHDNGVLEIQEGLAQPVTVTSDETRINNLIFHNLSSGNRENIGVDLTIEYRGSDNSFKYSKSLKTSASVRH